MTTTANIQSLCGRGQIALVSTDYILAESLLVEAERQATHLDDFDTLARLYMPLQEARRQRRQRCGEGTVVLDLIARSADDVIDPAKIIEQFPNGQLLVAGWGNVAPAIEVRRMQKQRGLYLESLLGASYPTTAGGIAVVLVPLAEVKLPAPTPMSLDELRANVPDYCVVLDAADLPRGPQRGTWKTYSQIMSLWEQLHRPFLTAADAGARPLSKLEGYRRTIEVDYACELAHQKLSDLAHQIARERSQQNDDVINDRDSRKLF